jgi:hypothetical protein
MYTYFELKFIMSETPSDTIWIVTDNTPQISIPDGAKSTTATTENWRDQLKENTTTKSIDSAVKVSAQKLEQEMSHFLQVIANVFNSAEQQAQFTCGIQLDEIELSIEISAEGQVKLIGSGAKAAGKGAITLTFRRKQPK